MKIDVYTEDVKINGKLYNNKLSIDEIIDIVDKTSGFYWCKWGRCDLYPNTLDGSVFQLVLKKDQLSVEWGDRFISGDNLLKLNKEDTLAYGALWSQIYRQEKDLGKVTPEQKYKIEKIYWKAVIFS